MTNSRSEHSPLLKGKWGQAPMGILHFLVYTLDGRSYLVPMLQRGNPYGMHSHAGAWERESIRSY